MSPSPAREPTRWQLAATLIALVVLNVAWKRLADGSASRITSYVELAYGDRIDLIHAMSWWEYFAPVPHMNGAWGTTGFLLVHGLELLLGAPVRALDFTSSACVVAAFLVTWSVYRDLLVSTFVGAAFALSTFNYHAYHVSGCVIVPLIVTWLLLHGWTVWRLFQRPPSRWDWAAFGASLAVLALSYEGWLDVMVAEWFVLPFVAHLLRRRGEEARARVARRVLAITTAVAIVYTAIKLHTSYTSLHRPGLETDLIVNYRGLIVPIGIEDVIVNVLTYFFTSLMTYVPPFLFNFSTSSWLVGKEEILRLQHGYDPVNAHLVADSHVFLWRFYAGAAFALFAQALVRVASRLREHFTAERLSIFVLMTVTLLGSPTHAAVKMRPMHSTPVLGNQVWVSVAALTLLLGVGLAYARDRIASPTRRRVLIAAAFLNLVLCALTRPSLLSHMAVLSGFAPYPDPLGH